MVAVIVAPADTVTGPAEPLILIDRGGAPEAPVAPVPPIAPTGVICDGNATGEALGECTWVL